MSAREVAVYTGRELTEYSFGPGHPWGADRLEAFWGRFREQPVSQRVEVRVAQRAREETLEQFHSHDYLAWLRAQCRIDGAMLDEEGETPAHPGLFEAACTVVGTTLDAVYWIMRGSQRRALAPIAGLHHAGRERAHGFCVVSDIGVAIEVLRSRYNLQRIAYVDMDAHHGDGVFYAFVTDPHICIVDIHEDGRRLFPGTGAAEETGLGPARGTKRNYPLAPFSSDSALLALWPEALAFLERARPQFILFQCGADSLQGDPTAHLRMTEASYRRVAADLCGLADKHCQGRLLAVGGGGYERNNLVRAWGSVVEAMIGGLE